MKRYLVVITILALVAVLVTGCAGAPSPTPTPTSPTPAPAPTLPVPAPSPTPSPAPAPTATGNEVNFRLLISDEVIAITDFDELWVEILSIGVHQAGDQGGWFEPPDFVPVDANLRELVDTNATEVWSGELDDGTYDKVKIYVGDVWGSLAGSGVTVKLPSGKLQISKPFEVTGGEVTNFVYDIAVVKAGESGKYILKPQIAESGSDKEFKEVPPSGRAGKSNIGHLYLREKDPNTWEIIDGGAWGKMKYNLSGSTFDFVFNGHGLEVENEYTLIYYPDPWPGNDLICLGSGIANEDGDVHIMGHVDTGDLPATYDQNHPDNGVTGDPPLTGAKIWLVLSGDVDCTAETPHMIGWTPNEYLFEYDRIFFDSD